MQGTVEARRRLNWPLFVIVAQGKGQPNASQKIQICAELGFLGPNSEYACVNLFRTYILTSLIPTLTATSFDLTGKRRMAKFAERFPDAAIVSTLSRQLSWSHMVAIVAPKTPQACQFYASQAATNKCEFGDMLSSSPSEAFCCNRRTAYQARKQNIGSCSLMTMQHQQLTINRDAKKC